MPTRSNRALVGFAATVILALLAGIELTRSAAPAIDFVAAGPRLARP